MLITCPECELQVSDKATTCPHCGYPLKADTPRKYNKKKTEHMRLPNGFGQISKVKGANGSTLRKPYRAMITVGKNDKGKPICRILKPEGYFETYNEAYTALMEYNKNPYDLNRSMSVKELYDKWSSEYFKNITESSKRTITSAWAYCKSVYDMPVQEVRVRHIKGCIDDCDSPSIKNRIKSMFNLMLDYAVEYEIVDKNYARDFKTEKAEAETEHSAFSEDELNIMWKNTPIPLVNAVLLQCYTGWRPQELCLIKLEDVDLENWTMMGGMKTEAGKNRIVPVCSDARSLLQKLYALADMVGSKTLLCNNDGSPMSYNIYYKKFMKLMEELEITGHRPHDPRKTFITLCKNAGVDEYAIKYMVGHSIDDITEKIYTERDPKWLSEEVEKIKRS